MDIELYHEFITLSKKLNFHESAKDLCVSPSTLSKHISSLEKHYGARLFNRDKQQVSLTNAGEFLLERALSIWDLYEQSIESFQGSFLNESTLSIGGLLDNPEGYPIVSKVIDDLRMVSPNASLRVVPCFSLRANDLTKSMLNGEMSCAVVYKASSIVTENEFFDYETILDIPVKAVISKDALICNEKVASIFEFSGKSFIQLVSPRFTPTWNLIQEQLHAYGFTNFTIRPVAVSTTYDYSGIAVGESVFLLPRGLGLDSVSNTPKHKVVDLEEKISLKLDVLFLKERRTPLLEVFIEVMKKSYGEAFLSILQH